METLNDVIKWFESNKFILNPLITIALIGGAYNAPIILAILIYNNKNDKKLGYTSKASYLNYLRS